MACNSKWNDHGELGVGIVSRLACRMLVHCAAAAVLASCGTRPQVDDVTGVNAFRIAQAIRCELRDALIELVAGQYASAGDVAYAKSLRTRDFNSSEADEEESKRFVDLFKRAKSDAKAAQAIGGRPDELTAAILRYEQASVGYEFDLDLTRTNSFGGGIDLLGSFSRGTISASPGASFEGKRNAIRSFRLLDPFSTLLTNRPTIRVCNDLRTAEPQLRSPNGAYPIAGRLGLDRLLREFISFNQSANLVGPVSSPTIPTMAETIEFTTTLGAGIAPELKLAPLGQAIEITGAKLSLSSSRVDRHKVVLTFSLPATEDSVTIQRSETSRAAIDELERQRLNRLDERRVRVLEDIVGE